MASDVAHENNIPLDVPGSICSAIITGTLFTVGTNTQYVAMITRTVGIKILGPPLNTFLEDSAEKVTEDIIYIIEEIPIIAFEAPKSPST